LFRHRALLWGGTAIMLPEATLLETLDLRLGNTQFFD
jgi:hypothetical protein